MSFKAEGACFDSCISPTSMPELMFSSIADLILASRYLLANESTC